ncbi:MAG TPA: type II toxin-antitoxin system VapC family toxin [Myxococcales bacterium]|jgi:predicted nucleic acid-binding protein
MVVVDASALVEVLIRGRKGDAVTARLRDEELHAPHIVDLEVTQVLRRLERTRALDPSRCSLALRFLQAMSLFREPHEPLLQRCWELSANFTAYDAAYIALAEALEVSLITCDARLHAAPGHRATIELF